MSVRMVQNSFVGGEISPALYGRHDLEAYYKGAARLENFLVLKTGGARKRNGFVDGTFWYTAGTTGTGIDTRTVPYRYSREDGGLLILKEKTVSGVKYTDCSYLKKGAGFNDPNSLATVTLPAYIYPPSIKWTQVGDTVILSGETGPAGADGTAPVPASVSSVLINHPAGTLTAQLYSVLPKPVAPHTLSLTELGDFIVSNTSSKARTLYYASYTVTGGVISLATMAYKANTNAEWPVNCAMLIRTRIRKDAAGVWPDEVIIAKRSGALYGELVRLPNSEYTLAGSDSGGDYREYEFRDENHIPGSLVYKQTPMFTEGAAVAAGCCAVYQQRLAFAGLPGDPFSVVFSRAGDFHAYHASRPVAQDDPFRFTLATDSPAVIRHAAAYRDGFLLFTDTGVWRLYGSLTEGFGPQTCRSEQLNDIGCDGRIRPVQTTDGFLYVGADGRTVYELRYDIAQDAVAPSDRSILAAHLTEGRRIISAAHQRYPESVVWFVLDNGTLIAMTYQPEHKVCAWSRHSVAGLAENLVQIVSPGTVTGDVTDLLIVRAKVSTVVGQNGSVCRLGVMGTAYTDFTAQPVGATLTTLRPELPDRNVQGLPKNITDALVRVRNTERLAVVSAAGGLDDVHSVPGAVTPYSGDLKSMPRGCINDAGQMTLVSASGPCEIQCVVWKTEF